MRGKYGLSIVALSSKVVVPRAGNWILAKLEIPTNSTDNSGSPPSSVIPSSAKIWPIPGTKYFNSKASGSSAVNSRVWRTLEKSPKSIEIDSFRLITSAREEESKDCQ